MSDPTSARIERDTMGPMEVPAGAYYGASTMRAVLNFPISDLRLQRDFIRAMGLIKLAAARTNNSLGLLDSRLTDAIVKAAREVADGAFDEQFVVDVFQTGSGTSTNMNLNEVIANRAGEHLGQSLGSKAVHPNDHVNMGQSSNDVFPTAIHPRGAHGHGGAPQAGAREAPRGAGREERGVRDGGQDRPYTSPGRDAHHPGARVQRLRGTGGARPATSQGRRGRALGSRPGRHGGGQWREHPRRVRAARLQGALVAGGRDRARDRQPLSGPEHPRRGCPGQRLPADRLREPPEDRQRPALARLRPPGPGWASWRCRRSSRAARSCPAR